jgi:hypothetical protein
MLSAHEDIKNKIDSMEKKYDHQFKIVFDAVRELVTEELKPERKIGFERKRTLIRFLDYYSLLILKSSFRRISSKKC